MKNIIYCQKCDLYKNQKPLLDNSKTGEIMWVGLSAKKVDSVRIDIPLAIDTNSGKVIQQIEDSNSSFSFYRTNLVKCLPLDERLEIRYPNQLEKETCYNNLQEELLTINPKLIFLLGLKTADFVLSKYNERVKKLDQNFQYYISKYAGLNFVPIHHPSYVYVYKRKRINEYINSISSIIRKTIKK